MTVWQVRPAWALLLVAAFFLGGMTLGVCFGLIKRADVCATGSLECECVR